MVEDARTTLGWVDYVVIVTVLGISSSIGVYFKFTGGRQRTWEEYFIANRSMSIVPVAIGLMISYVSAITLLGVSAEMYIYGTQYLVINLIFIIGGPISMYCYIPVFFKLQATSTYEYLERRFGTVARLLTSIVCVIQMVMYTGVVLYAPAIAIEATTNLPQSLTIVVIGLVVIFYSALGGIKAVLITDVFQYFVMCTSILIIVGTSLYNLGGFGEIWRIAREGGRIQFDSVSVDPTELHTWWSLMIGGSFMYMALSAVGQIHIQRLLTLRKIESAQLAMFFAWPVEATFSIITAFTGLAMYANYRDCDPLTSGRITSSDQLLPLYVLDTLGGIPGMSGLFIAGIFSAGLSTVSAVLNSLAAISLEDYLKPGYKKWTGVEIPRERSLLMAKGLAIVFGIICIGFAFLSQALGGVLEMTLSIMGLVGGPLLGIFTLGMFTESATQFGANTGLVIGLLINFWIGFGQPRPSAKTLPVSVAGCGDFNSTISITTTVSTLEILEDNDDTSYFYLYRISYMWYSLIGCVLTVTIGLLVSILKRIILREEQPTLDPDLFTPFLAKRIRARRLGSCSLEAISFKSNRKISTYNFANEPSRRQEPHDAEF